MSPKSSRGGCTMTRCRMGARLASLLCLVAAVAPALSFAPAASGTFLVISDIHFNPFYDASLFMDLAARPSAEWPGILAKSQPVGINLRGTDSNFALLTSSLDDARAR